MSTKYRGTLSATDQGELLFRFPYGFSLPLTKRPWWKRAVDKVSSVVRGVGKFVVRAWVSIVMIGYAAVFLAIALALMFSGRSDSDRGGGNGGAFLYVLLRVISEALFWTFHPFSPVAQDRYARRERRRSGGKRVIRRFGQVVEIDDDEPVDDDVPFYEKVNRFVFGPEPQKEDPKEVERRLLAHIRNHAGRIGLLDVMSITGLPREEADPLLARLLLDYEGEVDVSDDGAITYRFEALRKTTGATTEPSPPPVWTKKVTAPPVTGNASGSNFLVGAINAFNLVAATIAINANLTLDRLFHIFEQMRSRIPLPALPYDGVPIALGVVPLFFSAVIFALPLWRALRASSAKKKADEENARRAVLATVAKEMEQAAAQHRAPALSEQAVKQAWQQAAGSVDDDAVTRAIVELGGDVDVDDSGRAAFRFRDLEAEVKELQQQRERASAQEQSAGAVVFRAE